MTRHARGKVLYDGCYAHVFSRSIDTRRIFQHPENFEYFKALLAQYKKIHGFFIHHYCLMHTHFHLAVSLADLNEFSEGLKTIKWKYTRYYNKQYKRRGPLWQERFKSLVIENEAYLCMCGQYIENNPVKAGLVARAVNWPYSSAGYYERHGKADEVVDGYERPVIGNQKHTDEFFVDGVGIGSELFRIQLKDGVKTCIPVP